VAVVYRRGECDEGAAGQDGSGLRAAVDVSQNTGRGGERQRSTAKRTLAPYPSCKEG